MTIDEWNDYHALIDHLKFGLSDAAERRRYALLQAAATIDAALAKHEGGMVLMQSDGGMEAVERAMHLLELIESREPAAAKEPA